MNVFISGGCKNGKSYYAQGIAKKMSSEQGVPLYYVATMIPGDEEDQARIARHIRERAGWGFTTIEQGRNICEALDECIALTPKPQGEALFLGNEPEAACCRGVFLLDSVTALLSNEMFLPGGEFNPGAGAKVARDLLEFAARTGSTVFVSDYIYSDSRIFDSYTEDYRRALACIDRALARECDQVVEVAYGNKYFYK